MDYQEKLKDSTIGALIIFVLVAVAYVVPHKPSRFQEIRKRLHGSDSLRKERWNRQTKHTYFYKGFRSTEPEELYEENSKIFIPRNTPKRELIILLILGSSLKINHKLNIKDIIRLEHIPKIQLIKLITLGHSIDTTILITK